MAAETAFCLEGTAGDRDLAWVTSILPPTASPGTSSLGEKLLSPAPNEHRSLIGGARRGAENHGAPVPAAAWTLWRGALMLSTSSLQPRESPAFTTESGAFFSRRDRKLQEFVGGKNAQLSETTPQGVA